MSAREEAVQQGQKALETFYAGWGGKDARAAERDCARVATSLAAALKKTLAALSGPETENWEYVPGHRWVDRNGEEHWFVRAGTISPGYVQEYMAQGREAIRRRVGPWEPVPVEEDNR